jgi:hypothetical protein
MPVIPPKEALREVAIQALVQVAQDPDAAPAARAAAARTLLESIGLIGRLQELAHKSEKPLSELTAAEIDLEIARLRPKLAVVKRKPRV